MSRKVLVMIGIKCKELVASVDKIFNSMQLEMELNN